MFSLSRKIDDTIEIDDVIYKVDMSFDNILRFIELINDEKIPDVVKVSVGVEILLDTRLEIGIDKLQIVYEQLFHNFIAPDTMEKRETDRLGNPLPQKKVKELYSFIHDAEYIYASFVQAYGIDLFNVQGELHWNKFKALLNGLPDDTKLKKVIEIRTRPMPKGKGTSEERKELKELKEAYALPGQNLKVGDE